MQNVGSMPIHRTFVSGLFFSKQNLLSNKTLCEASLAVVNVHVVRMLRLDEYLNGYSPVIVH